MGGVLRIEAINWGLTRLGDQVEKPFCAFVRRSAIK